MHISAVLPTMSFRLAYFPLVRRLEPLKLVKTRIAFSPSFSVSAAHRSVSFYPPSRLGLVAAVILVSTMFPTVISRFA